MWPLLYRELGVSHALTRWTAAERARLLRRSDTDASAAVNALAQAQPVGPL
jgi:hypothetical protein